MNGVLYDLAPVPEGGLGEPEGDDHPFVGSITRESGIIHAAVRVLLGDTAAPVQPGDPAHWILPEAEEEIAIPAVRRALPEGVADVTEGA